jgi:hypothetical protein
VERYEKQGYWWLPINPEKRVAGTLVFGHDTDSHLQLLGSMQDGLDALKMMGRWGTEYRPQIILGLSSDGKEYTLFDCLRMGASLSAFVVESFYPSIVIEGRHFSSLDAIVLQQMTVRMAHFGEWYQRTGREIVFEDVDKDSRKTILTHQKPDNLSVTYEGGRIEFGHDANIKFARFRGDFVISEEACFSVLPDRPLPLLVFLDEALPPILHFFNLGIGRTLTVLEFRGKAALDCDGKTDDEVRKAPLVKLYWKRPLDEEDKELFPHDMVATCSDFGEGLQACFGAWLNAYEEIKPVMQLFFGRVLPREPISPNSFLNSVQAVEAYHRYRRDGLEFPETEYQKRLSRMLETIGEEYREWLAQKLQYSNEKGLRKRLKELLRERQGLFDVSDADIKRLANRATELRNFFTHYTDDKGADFGTAQELYLFGQLFKWVMIACLLEEMDISRARAHELIRRNQSFLYFKTVQLKGQQAELLKVETVSADEVPKLEAN